MDVKERRSAKSMGHRKFLFIVSTRLVHHFLFQIRKDGGPGQTRTADLTIISRALYPTELQAPLENLERPNTKDVSLIGNWWRLTDSNR